MNGLNKAFFLGRLGADPEARMTQAGGAVVRLSIGTPSARKVNEEWVEGVDWHRVTFFGKDGEYLSKYAHKGDVVCVECSVRPRKWTDADGKTHYEIDFVGQRVSFIQSRARSVEASAEAAAEVRTASSRGSRAEEDGDEIPF